MLKGNFLSLVHPKIYCFDYVDRERKIHYTCAPNTYGSLKMD